jgi:glucose-6-phosphate isomerase
MTGRESLASWQSLEAHALEMKGQHMRTLFREDHSRFEQFSIELPGLLLDYSKNLITSNTVAALLKLAVEADIEGWRQKMFAGDAINQTENRAVLHTALRAAYGTERTLDGENISKKITQTLKQIELFSERVRSGAWLGYSQKPVSDVVCIGIGGSHLGPQMVTEALKNYSDHRLHVHYVSTVDGTQIADVLGTLNPATTLFVIASKTFTTAETMTNANTALRWFKTAYPDHSAVSQHFVAVTAADDKAQQMGIDTQNIFPMWDWVGGRYSLWSAIGLPIALYLGFDVFRELLAGASDMDQHFQTAPLGENIPVMLALIGIWNSTFLGSPSQAILPYDQPLHMLPAYLQQADMESNGKSVNWEGHEVPYTTGPIIWGQTGINGQHAFYQLLHQGTHIVPADFIGSVESLAPLKGHHENLMANFFAQTQALMTGIDATEVESALRSKGMNEDDIKRLAPHKVHRGNRPSNTILMDKLDPRTLGKLLAMYEHKIFVQGIIWQIYSFDQWGVELGKILAKGIEPQLGIDNSHIEQDDSTRSLIKHYQHIKEAAAD